MAFSNSLDILKQVATPYIDKELERRGYVPVNTVRPDEQQEDSNVSVQAESGISTDNLILGALVLAIGAYFILGVRKKRA